GGHSKYRDSGWGVNCTVAYEQESDASRSLTVRGYLAEKRRPGQITGVGQADLAARCAWKIGRQSSAIGVEDEVCGNRGGNICARVRGRGPRRRNTIWVHGAAGRVRWLWAVIQYINAVLCGDRRHAKQQYGSPDEQHQQLFHRFLLVLSLETNQVAYEAAKQAGFAQPIGVDLSPGATYIPQ